MSAANTCPGSTLVSAQRLSGSNTCQEPTIVRGQTCQGPTLVRGQHLSGPNNYQGQTLVRAQHMSGANNLSGPNTCQGPTFVRAQHLSGSTLFRGQQLIKAKHLSGANTCQGPTLARAKYLSGPTLVRSQHLSGTKTCQGPTLVRGQHLSGPNTCQSQILVRAQHLSGPTTCQWPTLVLGQHLSGANTSKRITLAIGPTLVKGQELVRKLFQDRGSTLIFGQTLDRGPKPTRGLFWSASNTCQGPTLARNPHFSGIERLSCQFLTSLNQSIQSAFPVISSNFEDPTLTRSQPKTEMNYNKCLKYANRLVVLSFVLAALLLYVVYCYSGAVNNYEVTESQSVIGEIDIIPITDYPSERIDSTPKSLPINDISSSVIEDINKTKSVTDVSITPNSIKRGREYTAEEFFNLPPPAKIFTKEKPFHLGTSKRISRSRLSTGVMRTRLVSIIRERMYTRRTQYREQIFTSYFLEKKSIILSETQMKRRHFLSFKEKK
ncbi:hypothetical protein Btru_075836 [Bulinus truncatus]|nr:hypothetical protein Btru_075836 [Bulinus truncatus]